MRLAIGIILFVGGIITAFYVSHWTIPAAIMVGGILLATEDKEESIH